jgi:hypothetical protein
MNSLSDELRIEVFKYLTTPISLALSNNRWYTISQDSHARAEWLIHKYGKSHALFHAVRLGKNFLTLKVVQTLISRNVLISRYFIQRLHKSLHIYDEQLKLMSQMFGYNSPEISWGNDIPLPVFDELFSRASDILKLNEENFAIKANDMDMFYLLTSDPIFASQGFIQNIDQIRDLILNKKFAPFPPDPQATTDKSQNDRQYSKKGFESGRQLMVIARAILIYPELVNLWKEIGHHEICDDVNELVIARIFFLLFPSSPPLSRNDQRYPSMGRIIGSIGHFMKLGFKITDKVMEQVFFLMERRLNIVGDTIMDAFQLIRKKTKSEIAIACLTKTVGIRNLQSTNLLEFLIKNIDEPIVDEMLIQILNRYKVGFLMNPESIKTRKAIRSLSLESNFYYWILKNYGPSSEITKRCFDDILESRVWIDLKSQEERMPEGFTQYDFKSTCSIYLEYCNEKILFQEKHLDYLLLTNNDEIIKPLFGISLPIVFGSQIKEKLPLKIPRKYKYERPIIINLYSRRKDDGHNMVEWRSKWLDLLQKIQNKIHINNSDVTENFKIMFERFWRKTFPDKKASNRNQNNKRTGKKPPASNPSKKLKKK